MSWEIRGIGTIVQACIQAAIKILHGDSGPASLLSQIPVSLNYHQEAGHNILTHNK
jgi:hypothetical protein